MLALAVMGPPAIVGTGLELWLKPPGHFLLVTLLMAGFLVYSTALAPVLPGIARRRHGSVAAAVNAVEASFTTLITVGAIVGLLVGAGLHLRLLPGFALIGLFALTGPLIAQRGLAAGAAIKESFILAQRNLVGLVALGATAGATSAGIYMVASFLFSPLPAFFEGLAAILTTTTLAAPFAATAFARTFDLRSHGTRLVVLPTSRTSAAPAAGAIPAASVAGQVVESTIAAIVRRGATSRGRVAYVARSSTPTGLPRYSPDAATMTFTRAAVRGDGLSPSAETNAARELPTTP
ncbi:MAG: hypothetical protein OXG37_13985 [Actinomycetia bacterium]|nr:hypothetical protein [Actinomycetes bacterium]